MKKRLLFLIIPIFAFLVVGCGKTNEKSVFNSLVKNIENSKGYHLSGIMEIINNEDSYTYDIDVSYEKDDNFRVSLKNQVNNHEQIILKNKEGVYVLTPSLNKSFKFQSEWPYNNSQAYLLQTLIKDLKNDSNKKFTELENGYMFNCKVEYSNNKELVSQNIYLDKNLNITKVEVLDNANQVQIKVEFKDYDLKSTFDDKYFTLSENMNSTTHEEIKTTSKIEDIVYPMYIPSNTYLSSQDTVSLEDGERVILTFSGDENFTLIQETVNISSNLDITEMAGDFYLLSDTVGAVTDYSVDWISNGVEYYLVSETLGQDELLKVAKSIGSLPVAKVK